jgi:hypothetical protein
MANILLRNLSPGVMKLIYEKQCELQKEKLRRVPIDQTIEVLLKDAYLRKTNEQNVSKL